MKNINRKIILGIIAPLFALSCSNENEISSAVTVYPVITLSGESPYFLNVGDTYEEPGAIATIGENEVPLTTRFVGRYRNNTFTTLDTNVADFYNVQYTATNEDGFSATSVRQVIVAETGDLVNSIEGLYTSTVYRNGTQGAPASAYTDIEYILIWKNSDGSYGISDAFGGWYLFGRAIADSETPGGKIVANNIPSNDFSFPATMTNRYFGGTSRITGVTVNPTDKSIDVTTTWATAAPVTNYTFTFHLKQVQF